MEVILDIVGVVTIVVVAVVLFQPRISSSTNWRATVTPLASIIGSGFLVMAPLLNALVGSWAPLAITGILAAAYAVGAVIRFNIAHVEPALEDGSGGSTLRDLDHLSDLSLGLAYAISVGFYLRLLSSFLLRPVLGESEFWARVLTTTVMVGIALVAWLRGLDGMEKLEEVAVNIKLSIIGGLILTLVVFDVVDLGRSVHEYGSLAHFTDPWNTVRALAGMLIVVQGFETSRYLGHKYDSTTRILTMKRAQWISAAIYVVFIVSAVPLFNAFPARIDETAILDGVREAAPLLVPMVLIAAVFSQLSAGIADTAGGGGMLTGRSTHHSVRMGYVTILAAAGVLVWSTNIFSIISLASRAFAVYYLIQAISAAVVAHRKSDRRALVGFVAVGAMLAFVVIAAIPAGS